MFERLRSGIAGLPHGTGRAAAIGCTALLRDGCGE
ncbi:hypothetical protein QO009_000203 [Brevibacillus aydinogluensis]|nr:hypothetical protein [Brevibacillus aydinogluensis]